MARYKYIDTNARFLAVDLAGRQCLLRHAVETAYERGWSTLKHGELDHRRQTRPPSDGRS